MDPKEEKKIDMALRRGIILEESGDLAGANKFFRLAVKVEGGTIDSVADPEAYAEQAGLVYPDAGTVSEKSS